MTIQERIDYLKEILKNAPPDSDAYDFDYFELHELERELENDSKSNKQSSDNQQE